MGHDRLTYYQAAFEQGLRERFGTKHACATRRNQQAIWYGIQQIVARLAIAFEFVHVLKRKLGFWSCFQIL